MIVKDEINSIAIFRALQLGDMLCAVPAFRALRNSFPHAKITILGMPWMKGFVERFSNYLDEFIWFPGYPGLPEQPLDRSATASFIRDVINRKFDLAIQMQGNGSVINPLVELFGAKHVAGFCTKGHYCPPSPFFINYPEGISEIHRHLKLMQVMGVEGDGDYLEFPITSEDVQQFENCFFNIEEGKYICIHAGSRGSWRQWPTAYFAKVADQCFDKGYTIVLTGTADELPIVQQVASHMINEPIIAAGKTSLGAMAVLLQRSAGLISNCTGVSHIASALKVKSVVISMDGEPERWAPLNTHLHTTIDWTRNENFDAVRAAVEERFVAIE
jgi:ADP-heptose:LPS heptosyltransferase